jgi:hypothetical protein
MYLVGITADLNDEDETGYVWTLSSTRLVILARSAPELWWSLVMRKLRRCARSWTSCLRAMA